RTQIDAASRSIARGYLLFRFSAATVQFPAHDISHKTETTHAQTKHKVSPQILIGASSSNKTGCDMKISLALVQSILISPSATASSCPGAAPLRESSCSIAASPSSSRLMGVSAAMGQRLWEAGPWSVCWERAVGTASKKR